MMIEEISNTMNKNQQEKESKKKLTDRLRGKEERKVKEKYKHP
jgi:hypothetical protein